MENLQNFGVKELEKVEVERINGGNWFWGVVAGGIIYDALKYFIFESDWEAHGRRMQATGSPGGHK